jgi:hypothetical protein
MENGFEIFKPYINTKHCLYLTERDVCVAVYQAGCVYPPLLWKQDHYTDDGF